MGSPVEDKLARGEEKPVHQVDIPYDYWMGRYPVTVAQFRDFVGESGHELENPESLEGLDNHPVTRVSWHDAREFCAWLTYVWRDAEALPEGWEVRLPTEAEWEKAARGGLKVPAGPLISPVRELPPVGKKPHFESEMVDNPNLQRRYPWGDDADTNRANYGDTGIEGPSAVGCFPGGGSPYGCLDMSGNVWEWTLSLWGQDFDEAVFRYPYEPADGREYLEVGNDVHRVLRNGSFIDVRGLARCAGRYRGFPDLHGDFIGFRIVISPTKD
jgi:iron(II)-dependent oxidoreductase